jgi:putative flavoprotein involved in K+ transport
VLEQTAVAGVDADADGFTVRTSEGPWSCRAVVVATGAASLPRRPALAADLPGSIVQLDPTTYRNPEQLRSGPVLVVGASASGVQVAEELQRSGRQVVLSVGDHVRVPRTYRGMDISWWMHTLGVLDERWDEVDDIDRARRLPSLQLVGSDDRRDLDLTTLHADGVEVVGRLAGLRDGRAQFSGGLTTLCRSADLKQARLLDRIDAHAAEHGLDAELGPPERPEPTRLPVPRTEIGLGSIATVFWATGFRVDHRWVDPAVRGPGVVVAHDGGVGRRPGLFVLGLPFQRRRSSTFLSGVGADAEELAVHVLAHLDATSAVSRR